MAFLTAFVIACGILSLLWCAFGRFFLPACTENLVTLWYLSGDCPKLEWHLRSIRRWQNSGSFPSQIIFVDCGLTDEGRKRAELLAKDGEHLLVSQQEILTYLDVTRADHGTGI